MQSQSSPYPHLSYGRAEFKAVIRSTYDELVDFVASPPFAALLGEVAQLSAHERPGFVQEVLLDDKALLARGISTPEGVLIQRSAFGDRRPTLFVVKKFLPPEYSDVWENVNITFDNEYVDEMISREPRTSWRAPLPVEVQAQAMADGVDLEEV